MRARVEAVQNQERPDLSDWLAESLRLTVFPAPEATPLEQGAWEQFRGTPPDRIEVIPRLSGFQAIGAWEDPGLRPAQLVMRASPTRIDWRAEAEPDGDIEGFPAIGEARVSIDAFRRLMTGWLPTCPPSLRLAFGAVLLIPAPSLADANRTVLSFLPIDLDHPGNVHDLLLQLNRRRRLSVLDIEVNRISKWSAAAIVLHRIELTGAQLTGTAVAPEHWAAQLELDINTVPGRQESLPPNALPALLEELANLVLEIAQEGPIP